MAASPKNLIEKSIVLTMSAALVLALAACAAPAQKPAEKPGAVATVAEPAVAEEIVDDFDGDGMEIPLDGTSLAAFDASLAKVKRHTTEDNYVTLENAIGYLLVYDLGAKRSREKLAQRLNGLTGYEVIAKVGWRKPPPGKSSVEKGAADGKIINT